MEEMLSAFREGGRGRTRDVHVIGPLASSDGLTWDEDEFDYTEDGRVITTVKYNDVRRCDCGAVLCYGNQALGTCRVCSRVVCKDENCGSRCEHCGDLVCGRHAVRIGGHNFCSRHRMHGYWLAFWGLLK